MSKDKNPSPEENAVSVLKEVNQKIKDKSEADLPNNDQVSSEEVTEQLKGSDADIDRGAGYDDQPDIIEANKQIKGSDADTD